METFLYILFFLSCVILVIAVLLQPGKTDAGALFTSGVSSAALNPRGTQSVLSKLTIGAATMFMLTALLLSLPALTGERSVINSGTAEDPAANTNTNANANVNANANANVNAAPNANAAQKPAEAPAANTGNAATEAVKPAAETKVDEKPADKKDEKPAGNEEKK